MGESVMAGTSKDRVETPQLTLVRATLPLLEVEQAYLEACQRWADLREHLPLKDWPESELGQELRMLRSKFQRLLGADDLAEDSWARIINAVTFEPWPQPLEDFDSRDLAMLYLRSNPEWRWGMWYLLFKRPLSSYAKTLCIGTCGFKGPPSLEGSVEIGYWLMDRYQAVDVAAEAVGALVVHAFEDSRVQRVKAEASARHVPTIRVLGKNGFRRMGRGRAPDSLLFERDREATLGA